MEKWKDIKGFEGKYKISSHGRVYSYSKKGFKKAQSDKYGYLTVGLCKEGKINQIKIHRLVAEAFIPNPNNLPQVNHKDENKKNNNVENLEWCTAQYNQLYGTLPERKSKRYTGNKNPRARKIRCVTTGQIFETVTEAAKYANTHRSNITKQIKGKLNTAGKHPITNKKLKWEYYMPKE